MKIYHEDMQSEMYLPMSFKSIRAYYLHSNCIYRQSHWNIIFKLCTTAQHEALQKLRPYLQQQKMYPQNCLYFYLTTTTFP